MLLGRPAHALRRHHLSLLEPAADRGPDGRRRRSFNGLLRFLAEGERHYHIALRHFIGRNFDNLPQYLSPENIFLILFRTKALLKHYDNVAATSATRI